MAAIGSGSGQHQAPHLRRLPSRPDRALMSAMDRPQKITFGEMRASGVRGVLVYCSDYKCSHSIALSADRWPDHIRLSDLEPRFVCKACGKRGADVRPDFNWNRQPASMMDPAESQVVVICASLYCRAVAYVR